MQLQAGFSFCIAPRFHSRLAWQERLRVNTGVEGDGRRFYPRDDWQLPSPAELALLVDDPAQMRGPTEALPPRRWVCWCSRLIYAPRGGP